MFDKFFGAVSPLLLTSIKCLYTSYNTCGHYFSPVCQVHSTWAAVPVFSHDPGK